ncbi:MAG: TolC family protein, partial [Alphaproteobacteria bacterium]|nr:TolC family protein [Alphaproteobacteria bacterium]
MRIPDRPDLRLPARPPRRRSRPRRGAGVGVMGGQSNLHCQPGVPLRCNAALADLSASPPKPVRAEGGSQGPSCSLLRRRSKQETWIPAFAGMTRKVLAKRGTTIMFAAIALGSCANPDMPQPKIQAVWIDATTEAAWPEGRWWTAFKSPELDQLIDTALTENRDLAAAAARILQAEAQAETSGAGRFPTVSGNSSANRSSRSIPGQASDGNTSIVSRSARATVQATYQLDLFGQLRNQSAAANQRIQSSQFDRDTVRLTLCASVATTYFQLLSARDRIRTADERLKIARQLLTLVETQRRLGTVSDLEVSQQRAQVAQQEGALSGLRQTERQALDALAALTGRAPSELSVAGATLVGLDIPQIKPGLPSEL